jgi:trehalose 2-sulfotransferase
MTLVHRPFHTPYLVCATQRSGSTLLCERLIQTGCAGVPQEYFEDLLDTGLPRAPRAYFHGFEHRDWPARLSPSGQPGAHGGERPHRGPAYAEHLAWAFAQGTTPNGVFGAKMMWSYLGDFLAYARHVPGLQPNLWDVFGDRLQFVWVRRRDRVRQAVSMWRAAQTARWRRAADDEGRARTLRYEEEAIGHLYDMFGAHDFAWGRWFAEKGAQPLELFYEDFAADQEPAVRAVFDLIGVDAPLRLETPPSLRKQSDHLSEEFIERFTADRGLSTAARRR